VNKGRCFVCEYQQPKVPEPNDRCPSCGARGSMRPVKQLANVGMGPLVGPSSVPITRAPLGVEAARLEERLSAAAARRAAPKPTRRRKPAAPKGPVARIVEPRG
jgi:hypothetical protein